MRHARSLLADRACSRCGTDLRKIPSMMSKFNTETLCILCKEDERQAPGYAAAAAAELAAVRGGDYNFPGVGLSEVDRAFLAELRSKRG